MTLPRTPSFSLTGKRALVTGATSGIGEGCAVALAEAGAHVTLIARTADKLDAQVTAFRAHGWHATALPLDIADIDATQTAIAQSGPFDILVNAAGSARHAPAIDTTEDDFDAVSDLNVKAAYFITRAVAKGLIAANKPGSLINISSQMAHVGGLDRAVYSATKHALEGMTKSMAIEWGPHQIRVNTVCPTFIRTPLTEQTFNRPERRAWIEEKIKLGRVGEVTDVMGAIAFLASDAAALITGTSLLIDGGLDSRLMVQKVTSLQVAKLAGVSQSAVSRVFTKGASASPATIAKVKAAATRLGYRPNVLARAMITGKSHIIGLVLAHLDNQFYPEAVERLSNALQKRGYHILIFTVSNSTDGIDAVVQDLMDYQVDGIIAASVSMSSRLAGLCHSAGIPVVLFNRGQPDSGLSSVTSANVKGGRIATQALIDAGHTRIAHIAGWHGSLTGTDRQQGFEAAMSAAELIPIAIIDGMYNRATAAAAARTLMSGDTPPDGIFVGNDHMAFAVMDEIRAMGFDIARDVSIIGYDDVPQAAWAAYDLSTMRQPLNRMVEATVSTLLSQIDGDEIFPQTIEIEGSLIQRGSSQPPKGPLQ